MVLAQVIVEVIVEVIVDDADISHWRGDGQLNLKERRCRRRILNTRGPGIYTRDLDPTAALWARQRSHRGGWRRRSCGVVGVALPFGSEGGFGSLRI